MSHAELKKLMAKNGAKGGRSTSPAKRKAARKNAAIARKSRAKYGDWFGCWLWANGQIVGSLSDHEVVRIFGKRPAKFPVLIRIAAVLERRARRVKP